MTSLSDIDHLIHQHGIVSDQVDTAELRVVLHELAQRLARQEGAIVEFGCYVGTTSLFIRRIMNSLGAAGEFHVYDSFEGLPEKTERDESPLGVQFKAGELSASKKVFMREFQKAGLALPVIHKGWFSDTKPSDVPDGITFAFLDGDYYESVRDPLRLITPKLLPGAVIVVDDYGNQALPGARQATDEWARAHGVKVREVQSLAVLCVR